MRFIEKVALGAGILVVLVTAVYRNVLTDDQRAATREASSVLRDATREVTDTVKPLISDAPTKSEEEAAIRANRARTAAQWSALGY